MLEILEQTGNRLVRVAGMISVVFDKITMGIPIGVVVVPSRIDLNEANPPFHQATGQKALSSEILGSRTVDAIETLDVFGFGVEVHGFRSRGLHFVRKFVGGDAGRQIGVVVACGKMPLVHRSKVVEQGALIGTVHAMGVFQIENWAALGAQNRSLITSWHVAARPVFRAADRATGFVQHHDVAGKVFIHASQAIVDPGTKRRVTGKQIACVHHEHGRAMNRRLGRHGVEKSNVVDTGTSGEQVGDHLAAFPVRFEVPLRPDDPALIAFSSSTKGFHLDGFAVEGIKIGFVVKGVGVAGSPVHEQKDNRLGLGGKRGVFGGKGIDELGKLLGHGFA